MFNDALAHDIGEWHLSGRYQPATICSPEQIFLKFRQLSGSEGDFIAYQKRRIDLNIAVLTGVQIKHELPKRAFESRQLAVQKYEPAA